MHMKLTTEQVQHMAKLARINMTEEEIQSMRDEMANILDHFEALQGVDVGDTEPMAHSADLDTVMRDDEVRPSRDKEDILMNAPHRDGDFIRVRSVLE